MSLSLTEEYINNLSLDNETILNIISTDLNLPFFKINSTVKLLKEENTIPFISRYRKEVTGYLDETQVRDIFHKMTHYENIESRKIEIVKVVFSRGMLNDELYNNIMKAATFSELEDIYAPYKRKKKTRAMIAIEKGLELLSELMLELGDIEIKKEAAKFVDPEKGVNTVEDALDGAMDILAEKTAHNTDLRDLIKKYLLKNAKIKVEGLKNEETSVYKMYYNFNEYLKEIKPHRILAINRGEREGELNVEIDFETEECEKLLLSKIKLANDYHKNAVNDGLKRLLIPSVTREIRSIFSDNADEHGIEVFVKNLKSLLMQPPIKKNRIIGIDPGIRTGTKGAALDETGKFLGYFLFYQEKKQEAKKIVLEAIKKYNASIIAVGNGTGSHEVRELVSETLTENNIEIHFTVVDEDGASVYSASDIAREEFPDLDLTIRGAISIGRRLQDPLAELVKIDPKSLGVGLYQHDVNQGKLSLALDEVVESVVNQVGVNINTASYSLLKYVSGLSPATARSIVMYRDMYGEIKERSELKKIKGLGDKTFEQAAGFLKILNGNNCLDATWVHPENYQVASEIYDILRKNKKVSKEEIKWVSQKYSVTENLVKEIIGELEKPSLDPREDYPKPIFQKGIISFDDLKVGAKVTGKIKNVVDFGAFVDIGIKESGLIHISEISNKYIKNPMEVLKVGDIKEFTIIDMDHSRKRISLSLKR
ncbi:MAG: RNA-binding transcriptional accessory protein [Spirochaetes bacterium]|nr:RNA-binding transcriptional accessory protein [Spirochaetota bacterium]